VSHTVIRFLGACQQPEQEHEPGRDVPAADAWLHYVPADPTDTRYVGAAIEDPRRARLSALGLS
jgi:hypothetical protein